MQLRILFVLYLIALETFCIAQNKKNFSSGYIVNNTNDTIKGMLYYESQYQKITFYTSKSYSKKCVYSVDEVCSFQFSNSVFKRFPFKRNLNFLTENQRGQSSLYERLIEDSVFFSLKVKGDLFNLYEFVDDESGRRNYIIQGNACKYQPLQYCLCNNEEHLYTWEHNKFREKLCLLALENNCTANQLNEIQNSTIEDIESLSLLLNRKLKEYFNLKKLNEALCTVFVGASTGLNKFRKYTGYEEYEHYLGGLSSVYGAFEISKKGQLQGLIFRFETKIQKYYFNQISFNAISLWLGLKIRKQFKNQLAVSIGGGFDFMRPLIHSKYKKWLFEKTFSEASTLTGNGGLRLGLETGRFEFVLSGTLNRYEGSNSSNNYNIQIGYRLNKSS